MSNPRESLRGLNVLQKASKTRARAVVITAIILLGLTGSAQCKPPHSVASGSAELLTVGPGDHLYNAFGHSAILIRRPNQAGGTETEVFNFGVTDFDRPSLLADFLEGKVTFWSERRQLPSELKNWRTQNREVLSHPIDLTETQFSALTNALDVAVHPKSRAYGYDTYRENCSTKVRDNLDKALGGLIYGKLASVPTGRTFRDDVASLLAQRPGLVLLITLLGGPSMDRPRSEWELCYLPKMLLESLQTVTSAHGRPLLGPTQILNTRTGDHASSPSLVSMLVFVCIAVFMFIATLLLRRLTTHVRFLLACSAAGISSLLGMAAAWGHLASDWVDIQGNWMLLVALPLDGIMIWPLVHHLRNHSALPRWLVPYLGFRVLTAITLVILSPMDPFAGPVWPRITVLISLIFMLRTVRFESELMKQTA